MFKGEIETTALVLTQHARDAAHGAQEADPERFLRHRGARQGDTRGDAQQIRLHVFSSRHPRDPHRADDP